MVVELEESLSIFDNINHEINQFSLEMSNNLTKTQELIAKIKERLFSDGFEELEERREKYNELSRHIEDLSAKELELTTKKQIIIDEIADNDKSIASLTESLNHLTIEQQKLQSEKENFKKELVKKHEALKLSVFYYKSALNIHIAIEMHTESSYFVTISFFTKSANDTKYSVRVIHNEEDGTCELVDIQPKITVYDQLAERLHKTQDIKGFFVAVRTIFKKIRDKMNK